MTAAIGEQAKTSRVDAGKVLRVRLGSGGQAQAEISTDITRAQEDCGSTPLVFTVSRPGGRAQRRPLSCAPRWTM
jgi:hypothetical protein